MAANVLVPPPFTTGRAAMPTLKQRMARLTLAFLLASLVGSGIVIGELTRRTVNNILHPVRGPVATTPASRGLAYEPVAFDSLDGTPLRGWFVPGTNGATIVTVHGLWGGREQNLGVTEWLRKRGGYAVLLFDLRACGESGGDTVTFGFREADDLLGAAAYVATRPDVDAQRIGVYGQSLGAATALLAAGRAPVFSAVVADSSFTTVENMITTSFQQVTGIPPFPFAAFVTWFSEQRTGLRPADISPLAAMPAISPAPVLLIHGGRDELIPAESSRVLFAAAREPKELWVVEGVDHAEARTPGTDLYERRVLDFFGKHVGGG